MIILFCIGNYITGTNEGIAYTQYGNEFIPADDPLNPKYIVGAIIGITLTVSGLILWLIGKIK
jgi:hypothetical protein